MNRISSFKRCITGILVVVIGLRYGMLLVSIPYQDPTAEMIAHYAFHSRIMNILLMIGFLSFILGVLKYIINKLREY